MINEAQLQAIKKVLNMSNSQKDPFRRPAQIVGNYRKESTRENEEKPAFS